MCTVHGRILQDPPYELLQVEQMSKQMCFRNVFAPTVVVTVVAAVLNVTILKIVYLSRYSRKKSLKSYLTVCLSELDVILYNNIHVIYMIFIQQYTIYRCKSEI